MGSMADKPWVMRTYSGHSSAEASNELYRTNLARGQTGLSIAFDLPTQIGYDPDSPEAAGRGGEGRGPAGPLPPNGPLRGGDPQRGAYGPSSRDAPIALPVRVCFASARAP